MLHAVQIMFVEVWLGLGSLRNVALYGNIERWLVMDSFTSLARNQWPHYLDSFCSIGTVNITVNIGTAFPPSIQVELPTKQAIGE